MTGSPFGLSDVGSRSAPTFVDIDGDGDLDAFVGEGEGNVNFFENTGSSTSAAFAAPLTDSPFGLSNVGSRRGTLVDGEPRATTFGDIDYVGSHSNPTLVDIDGDGDLDAFVGLFVGLFGEVFDPYLNFFENTGSSSSAAFDAPVTNAPFGLSRVGDLIAPTFIDIDGDGDLDAFVGRYGGEVYFFENVAPGAEVSIAALDAVQAEGDSGAAAFTFTVTRAGDATVVHGVDFSVLGSGADKANTADFGGAFPSGTMTFASGETSRTLTIEVTGDRAVEPDEGFTVTLSNPSSGAGLGTDSASGTIVTDDGLVFELSTSPAPLGLTDVGTESQVALGDLDGDGDLDALVGDTSGVMRYFENTGSASAPAYVQVGGSSPFGLPDVGTVIAPTLGDLDGDGDLDLLLGKNSGRMNYFENTGDGSSAAFVKVGGNAPFGLPDTGDRATPTLVDIDADGDVDLFVGDLDGGVRYFKNIGDVEEAVFAQRGGVTPYGLIDVGSRTTLAFVDLDGDGDFDALVGEGNGRVNYFENTGSAQVRAFAAPVTGGPFGLEDVGRRNAPVAADIDGDGDVDVLVGEEDGNINLFTNISRPTLSITALDAMQAEGHTGTTDLTFTVSRTGDTTATSTVDYGVIAHGGLDGDDFEAGTVPTGTVTFAVGEVEHTLTLTISGDVEVEPDEAFVVRLTNVSGGQFGVSQALGIIEADDEVGAPTFELSTATAPLGLTAVGLESRVTLGDLDGDLDALVGDATGVMRYYENTGSATAPAYVQVGGTAPFGLPDTGSFSAPALGDLDGDGDLDLLVGVNSGRFKYYENTGDGSSAAFVRVGGNAPFGLPDTGDLATPALVDIDADGDLDLFVGNLDGGIRYFKNIGDVEVAVFSQRGGSIPFGLIDVGGRSTPTLGDFDGDGDFDALVGEGNGRVNYFENTGSAQVRAFASPVTDSPFAITDVGRLSAPVAADLDGDGDIDVLVGEEDGNLNLFDNVSPPTLSITALEAQVPEGDAGTTAYTFTVARLGDTTLAVDVDYAVTGSGNDAAEATDFDGGTLPSDTLSFAAGESVKTLTIEVSGDTTAELDEGFTVTLSNPTNGAVLGTDTATGTVQDDDFVVVLGTSADDVIDKNAETDPQRIEGLAGDDTLTGSSAGDVLVGGPGNDLLTGGPGDELFIFTNGDGNDTINGFAAGESTDDRLDVRAFDLLSTFGDLDDFLTNNATESGGDTTLAWDADDSATLVGVAIADLDADDFLLV